MQVSIAAPWHRSWSLRRAGLWEWLIAGLSVAMFAGAILDAWAHVYVAAALEAVLTPWHAVVYVSFAALAITLLLPIAARIARRRPIRTAIPRSFVIPLVGGFIFLGAGGLDLAWHVAFGIEVGVEALLSPTHLGLAIGAGLLWSGPVISAWRRRSRLSMSHFLPGLLSMSAIVGLVSFTTHFAHPFVDAWPAIPYSDRDPASWYTPSLGFASLVIQTSILMGASLLLLRRWAAPPVGALTVLFSVSSAGLSFLHDEPVLLVVPVAAGLAADVLVVLQRDVHPHAAAVRLFAVLVPLAMSGTYFGLLSVTSRVFWSPHLWVGAVVMCAAVGFMVSLLVFPPGVPGHSEADG
jgi:hypothetical protein